MPARMITCSNLLHLRNYLRAFALCCGELILPIRCEQIGDLTLDVQTRRVVRGSREIVLRPREFDLLAFLAQHHDETVTRQMIAREVWREPNRATPLDNVVDGHLAHLRGKLSDGEDVKLDTDRPRRRFRLAS
jgi:DNA-binding response OmpR family regulator